MCLGSVPAFHATVFIKRAGYDYDHLDFMHRGDMLDPDFVRWRGWGVAVVRGMCSLAATMENFQCKRSQGMWMSRSGVYYVAAPCREVTMNTGHVEFHVTCFVYYVFDFGASLV